MTNRLPAPLDLHILRGDPFSIPLSSTIDGVDQTVTSGQPLAQIRKLDDTLLASFTVTVTNSGKTATISLSAAQTANLPVGRWIWDFQESPTGETWVGGTFRVDQDASHP